MSRRIEIAPEGQLSSSKDALSLRGRKLFSIDEVREGLIGRIHRGRVKVLPEMSDNEWEKGFGTSDPS